MIEYIIEDRVCYCIDKLILEIVRFNDCDLYIYLGFYIYIYIYKNWMINLIVIVLIIL